MQAAYDVFFIDYGNKEKVTDGHVRLIDGENERERWGGGWQRGG